MTEPYRTPATVKPIELITEKKPMDANEMYLRGHRVWGTVVALLVVCIFSTLIYAYHAEPEKIRAKTELAKAEQDANAQGLGVAKENANAAMQRAMAERAYTDRIMFETIAKMKECK